MEIKLKKTLQPTIENDEIVFGYGNPTLVRKISNTSINRNLIKFLNDEITRSEINITDAELKEKIKEFTNLGILTTNDYQTQYRYSRNYNFYEWIDISKNVNPIKYQNILSQVHVMIFGLGGIGSNVAEQLIRTGIKHFTLLDFDKVDYSNLTRQGAYTEQDINIFKTEACKNYLSSIDSKTSIKTINIQIKSKQDIEKLLNSNTKVDLIINCMDRPKNIDRWFDSISNQFNIPVIFGSYASTCANVFVKIPKITINYSDFVGENGIEADTLVKCEFPTAVIAPVTYILLV